MEISESANMVTTTPLMFAEVPSDVQGILLEFLTVKDRLQYVPFQMY